jgi:hypothetical protein
VNNTQKAGEVLECLANVFADGVVDKNDKIAVEQLEEAVNSAVKTLIETKISVRDAYEKAIKQ